jgi:lysophospholipase L1-like esterase
MAARGIRGWTFAAGGFLRDAWILVGITILLLIVVEIVAGLLLSARKPEGFGVGGRVDTRIYADDYRNASWVRQYFREYWEAETTRWESYVYWRRRPYAGELVNVDGQGVRRTTGGAPAAGGGRPPRVMFFGGSTMWGSGARDAHTIPSRVAARLAERGISIEAVNLGEGGWVSTQGLLELMMRLRRGDIPDIVVFYDGINDVYSSLQAGEAGKPQNERNRVREFNLTRHDDLSGLRRTALLESAKALDMYALAQRLARRFGNVDYEGRLSEPPDARALAEKTVGIYRDNLRKIGLLGKAHGFRAVFYWQPVILGKPKLTEYEAGLRKSRMVTDMEPFFQRTYALVDRATAELGREFDFHNIAGIFADVPEPVYIDWAHLSERGNDLIAARMVEDLARLLLPAR